MRNIVCLTLPCKEFPYGEIVCKIEVSKVIFRTVSRRISKKESYHKDLVSVITPNKYIYDFILNEKSKDIQVGDSVVIFPDPTPEIVEVIKNNRNK